MSSLLKLANKYILIIAFLQAWAATLGSLYFSEVLGYKPCLLCWYQRILMYPLIIILGIAIWRGDRKIYYYVLPLSILGAAIALYQYLLQMTPLAQITPVACSAYGPCREVQALFWGFVTIPFLSLVAFLVISAAMVTLVLKRK